MPRTPPIPPHGYIPHTSFSDRFPEENEQAKIWRNQAYLRAMRTVLRTSRRKVYKPRLDHSLPPWMDHIDMDSMIQAVRTAHLPTPVHLHDSLPISLSRIEHASFGTLLSPSGKKDAGKSAVRSGLLMGFRLSDGSPTYFQPWKLQ